MSPPTRTSVTAKGRPLTPRAPPRAGRQPVGVPRRQPAAIQGPADQPGCRDQSYGEATGSGACGQLSPPRQLSVPERRTGQLASPVCPHQYRAARGRLAQDEYVTGSYLPVRSPPPGVDFQDSPAARVCVPGRRRLEQSGRDLVQTGPLRLSFPRGRGVGPAPGGVRGERRRRPGTRPVAVRVRWSRRGPTCAAAGSGQAAVRAAPCPASRSWACAAASSISPHFVRAVCAVHGPVRPRAQPGADLPARRDLRPRIPGQRADGPVLGCPLALAPRAAGCGS